MAPGRIQVDVEAFILICEGLERGAVDRLELLQGIHPSLGFEHRAEVGIEEGDEIPVAVGGVGVRDLAIDLDEDSHAHPLGHGLYHLLVHGR